jgi:predicted TPR repeat methyltransferase
MEDRADMSATTATSTSTVYSDELQKAVTELEIALPAPGDRLEQDEEWVVVKVGDAWKRVRLHDYDETYSVQGLYERWVYEIFQCRSPQKIRELLEVALEESGEDAGDLVVLDLGAGNGYVADELRTLGAREFVGLDIVPEAAMAAERDRPGLYDNYVIGDVTNLRDADEKILAQHRFTCLTCVAALGFGDIPTEVFINTFNRVVDEGWIAFNIKTDFLNEDDQSGFSILIRRMLKEGVLDLIKREEYTHRVSTDGHPLRYEAFIGRKLSHCPEDWATG